jgi:SHS family lactate transporter-like MFS transporter
MILMIFLGPEAHGSHFEQAKVAFQRGAGAADQRDFVDGERDAEGKPTMDHLELADRKA